MSIIVESNVINTLLNRNKFLIRYKNAYTLAEVLITLGIVGIVVAMVLPMFMANFEEQKLVPKVQKAYSILKQGVIRSEITNAATDHWNYNLSAADFYREYLKDYFVIVKDGTVADLKSGGIVYYNMDGSVADEDFVNNDNTVVATLADGFMMFISEEVANNYKTIGVDVNGKLKPNIIGKDYFVFTIQERYGLMPYGYANGGRTTYGTNYNASDLLNDTPYGCHHIGAYCSAYLMMNGWKMGNNYPR